MPRAITHYCRKTDQDIPQTIGEISRCTYESLVLKYILNIKKLEHLIGRKLELLHIVGGGSQNKMLCQMISDAATKPVIAGPPETTAAGNIIMQMIGAGDIGGIEEGREIIRNSIKLDYYEPIDTGRWKNKFEIYKNIVESI